MLAEARADVEFELVEALLQCIKKSRQRADTWLSCKACSA